MNSLCLQSRAWPSSEAMPADLWLTRSATMFLQLLILHIVLHVEFWFTVRDAEKFTMSTSIAITPPIHPPHLYPAIQASPDCYLHDCA